MRKTFERDEHSGYDIGENISVHAHIHDPESWHLTIRRLEMFGLPLCSKDSSEDHIVKCIKEIISERLSEINSIVNEVDGV